MKTRAQFEQALARLKAELQEEQHAADRHKDRERLMRGLWTYADALEVENLLKRMNVRWTE
jgi:hypothetical protein